MTEESQLQPLPGGVLDKLRQVSSSTIATQHRIGRRAGRLYALRVFRDKTDLAASPNLWGKVTDAMDRSRYLIVCCLRTQPSPTGLTRKSPTGCSTAEPST